MSPELAGGFPTTGHPQGSPHILHLIQSFRVDSEAKENLPSAQSLYLPPATFLSVPTTTLQPPGPSMMAAFMMASSFLEPCGLGAAGRGPQGHTPSCNRP